MRIPKIVAIDPGSTVGFSSNCTDLPYWQIAFDNILDFDEYLLNFQDYDYLIYERFDHRQKNNIVHSAIEQIGVIKRFLKKFPNISPIVQGSEAKSKKSLFNDKALRHLSLYSPRNPDTKHGLDALRHRLIFEVRKGYFDLNRLKGLS